jgi:uncharacterized protein YjiS (DUF1127 family)
LHGDHAQDDGKSAIALLSKRMSRPAKTNCVVAFNSRTTARVTIRAPDFNGVIMTKLYLATVAAVAVTTSLASNLLLAGALGQERQLRLAARRGSRRLKHVVDDWVAGMIASRERQAALAALHRLTVRELGDIGLCRDDIGHAVRNAESRLRPACVRVRR